MPGDAITRGVDGVRLTNTRKRALAKRDAMLLPAPPRGSRWLPLADGRAALVDARAFARVSVISWWVKKTRYGESVIGQLANRQLVKLSHFILQVTGQLIDHRNGDILDNRRRNLRPASPAQSSYNTRKRANSVSSKFKGVSRHPSGRWYARIRAESAGHHLGYFADETAAAKAYDAAARRYHGAFACVNFPRKGERCALRPSG